MVHVIRTDGSIHAVAGRPESNYRYDIPPGEWSLISAPQFDQITQPLPLIGGLLLSATDLYISVSEPFGEGRIIRIDLARGRAELFAGAGHNDPGDNGPALEASLTGPAGMALAPDGSILVAEFGRSRVRRIDSSGTITTIAGTSRPRPSVPVVDPVKGVVQQILTSEVGDGGPAVEAHVLQPSDVAVDAAGNVFIAEAGGDRVRRVDVSGRISTVAGTGVAGYEGDNGPAASARLYNPSGLVVDGHGSLLIADSFNHRIRLVDAQGVIRTIAGTGRPKHTGDGGAATEADLDLPTAIAIGPNGHLYIGEESGRAVREVVFN